MHFLAEVDLGEIARRAGPSILPARGRARLFHRRRPAGMGGRGAACRGAGRSDRAAARCAGRLRARRRDFSRRGRSVRVRAYSAAGRSTSRRCLSSPKCSRSSSEEGDPDEWEARRVEWEARRLAAVDARFQRRQYFLSAEEAYKTLGMTARPSGGTPRAPRRMSAGGVAAPSGTHRAAARLRRHRPRRRREASPAGAALRLRAAAARADAGAEAGRRASQSGARRNLPTTKIGRGISPVSSRKSPAGRAPPIPQRSCHPTKPRA